MNAPLKMSVKGQIVIPKDVREALEWGHGTEFDLIRGKNSVTLKPRAKRKKTMTWEEFRKAVPPYTGPYIPEGDWEAGIGEMFRKEWQ